MVIVTFFQTLAAKLYLINTRLQRENLNFNRNEDFETLISAHSFEKNWLVVIITKMYPIMLILNSALGIIVCSIVADQMLNTLFFKDAGKGMFFFGLLPALNE